MLPAVQLAQAILFVDDVALMRDFYRDVLGLTVLDDEPGWVRLDAGSSVVALHSIRRAATNPLAGPPAERTDGHVKLCFHADDVDAARADLVARGVVMRAIHRHGGASFCDGIDPEGNVFQVTTR